jgi:HK97 family phage prohead protease
MKKIYKIREPEQRMFDLDIRRFSQEDGTFEAYISTWDTVDSFGTRFKKGAFKKTIKERLKKGDIKLLWQHDVNEPIGLVIGALEDDHGVLIHGKLDIGVQRADQARQQMGSGTINQFSFGFDIIKQQRAKDGFMDVLEVRLWEASPVTFGANPETSVVHVRSFQWAQCEHADVALADDDKFFTLVEDEVQEVGQDELEAAIRALEKLNAEFDDGSGQHSLPGSGSGSLPTGPDPSSPDDTRSTDFGETFDQAEFGSRGFKIMDALFDTLLDILYSYDEIDMVALSDEAFEQAHSKFVEWVGELTTRSMRATDPKRNTLSEATEKEIDGRALEDVAQDSSLSVDELSLLTRGQTLPLNARGRLAEFSKPVAQAHAEVRAEQVLSLFKEIRASGFSQAETIRLRSLLDRQIEVEPGEETTELLDGLRAINNQFL